VGATEHDIDYTRQCADWLKWSFDRQHGSDALIRSLLTGQWDEDRFLVLAPGEEVKMTADEQIITVSIRGGGSSRMGT
jgi:hypothetical protein